MAVTIEIDVKKTSVSNVIQRNNNLKINNAAIYTTEKNDSEYYVL